MDDIVWVLGPCLETWARSDAVNAYNGFCDATTLLDGLGFLGACLEEWARGEAVNACNCL